MNDFPAHTPGTGKELKPQPDGSVFLDEQATKFYQERVGSLMYLAQCTGYDTAFATVQYARSMAKPTTVLMVGGKRIPGYLRGSPNLASIYEKHSRINLVGFFDASYGPEDREELRSGTRSMFFVGNPGLVYFSSQLQKKVLCQQLSPKPLCLIRALNKAFTCRTSLANWG